MLDADQVAAAWRFGKAWELFVRLRRPSQLSERIDGSRQPDVRFEREDEARRELKRCRDIVGEHGFDLLVKVCAEGYHIRDLYPTRRERDTMSDLRRIHLESIKEIEHG